MDPCSVSIYALPRRPILPDKDQQSITSLPSSLLPVPSSQDDNTGPFSHSAANMGSDNSGKRAKTARLLVPLMAVVILFLGSLVFFVTESPNQVREGGEEEAAQQDFKTRSFAKMNDVFIKAPQQALKYASEEADKFVHNVRPAGLAPRGGLEEEEEADERPANPVASVAHVIKTFERYLQELHAEFDKVVVGDNPEITAEEVWEAFVALTQEHVLPLDTEYAPPDVDPSGDTTFISMATYRDENCPNTLTEAFKHANKPEGLYVGLVEQNCYSDCRTGVLKDMSIRDAPPDVDCVKTFCDGEMGKYCDHLRVLRINESESLGPAMARYFAAKLWHGESYYMQIDAHMFFAENWDLELKKMMAVADRPNPIITNYPPPDGWKWERTVGLRMCEGYFTEPGIEAQIVRLEGSREFESTEPATPRFAPYIAAGFFFTSGQFVVDVPFDPYLPWVFMGEEILLSSRAFTNGYHIFSPTINVLAHIYVRRNKPKFWETVGRAFKRPGFHNRLNTIVIRRVKNLLEYPETDDELVWPKSLIVDKPMYGMGTERTLAQYMEMVGLDQVAKTSKKLEWCHKGELPPVLLRIEEEERMAGKELGKRKRRRKERKSVGTAVDRK